jgi:signal peptidase II
MIPWKKALAIGAIVGSTVGCDRVTKHFVERELAGHPRQSYIGDVLRLEYAENRGAFLSLGAELPARVRTLVLSGGTALTLLLLGALLARRSMTASTLVGLSLVWGGGFSNLADRVLTGHVVDFLNLGVGPLRTGIFNVADIAITMGVGLVLALGAGGWSPGRSHGLERGPRDGGV